MSRRNEGPVLSAPKPFGCGGVFQNYRGFVKGCSFITLCVGFAHLTEINVVIKEVDYA